MAELINSGMRKGIKTMAVVAQTAQFIALMPKPKDFAIRVVGDIVYLSSQVKKLTDDMNKLLDSYTDIPINYLMTQFNSITGSLTNITNKMSTYAQSAINETWGIAEEAVGVASELTSLVSETSSTVANGAGKTVSDTATAFGNYKVSQDGGIEVSFELSSDGEYMTSLNDATSNLKRVEKEIKNNKEQITGAISGAASEVTGTIDKASEYVKNLVETLRKKMQELSDKIDGFGADENGKSNKSKLTDKIKSVSDGLKDSDDNQLAFKAAGAITDSMAYLIDNFSIGKVVGAFVGVITQTTIVRLGLDQLPPIDFESMLCDIRDELEMTPDDLMKQYELLSESAAKEMEELNDLEKAQAGSEDRNYKGEKYKEFKAKFDGDLELHRKNIRSLMMHSPHEREIRNGNAVSSDIIDEKGNTLFTISEDDNRDIVINNAGNGVKIEGKTTTANYDNFTKQQLKSAIKEMRKLRNQVHKAKRTDTWSKILKRELDNLGKEAENRCKSIKTTWESMMQQYKKSIDEITSFFTNGGSCDMFIDDTCDDINKQCDEIKELCKSLITQLSSAMIKVGMPGDIGPVFPNPGFKIPDLLTDIKIIFKFIKDLITCLLKILNDINKLARIMINGINSLKEIIKQLMKLLGLSWLIDLIQSIIDLFSDKLTNAREILLNTLSPVYFNETDEYNNGMDALDELMSGGFEEFSSKDITTLFKASGVSGSYNYIVKMKNSTKKSDQEDLEKKLEELEEKGDEIVAYKSPIIEEVAQPPTVSDLTEGGSLDQDIKFIGWHFYHPNLNHNSFGYGSGFIDKIIKMIKSKIIKKAAKTGNKKKGGVNKLRRSKVGKNSKRTSAYNAFYWYTYYTEDLEDLGYKFDTEDGATIIKSVVQTQNGSIVELDDGRKVFVADNMVKKGDYVVVDGIKYRVKK